MALDPETRLSLSFWAFPILPAKLATVGKLASGERQARARRPVPEQVAPDVCWSWWCREEQAHMARVS